MKHVLALSVVIVGLFSLAETAGAKTQIVCEEKNTVIESKSRKIVIDLDQMAPWNDLRSKVAFFRGGALVENFVATKSVSINQSPANCNFECYRSIQYSFQLDPNGDKSKILIYQENFGGPSPTMHFDVVLQLNSVGEGWECEN